MKIKENFMLRKLSDAWVAVPVGQTSQTFNGLINLNETAAFMWKTLSNDVTFTELVSVLTNKYDVSTEKAQNDAGAFIAKLREADLLDE